jgi:hypothetical protein
VMYLIKNFHTVLALNTAQPSKFVKSRSVILIKKYVVCRVLS